MRRISVGVLVCTALLMAAVGCQDGGGSGSESPLTSDAGDVADAGDIGSGDAGDVSPDTAPPPELFPEGECPPGFSADDAGACQPDPVSDPATRTKEEVCERWTGFHSQLSSLWWQEPADECDLGVLHPDVQIDALRRLNLYRWLVGLGPVTVAQDYIDLAQACATTLAADDSGLTHHISPGFECYTGAAADAASQSNLSMGRAEPFMSIDGYMEERTSPSLGHRRWCLNPTMEATGFGQRGRYSCMYAFDRDGTSSVDHVYYPSAGFYPRDALLGPWSASSSRFNFGESPEVSITRADDGSAVEVTNVQALPKGYALDTISWEVPNAETGVQYEVTISSGEGMGWLVYKTTLVDCP